MASINYKKISYILSEKPSLSGQIAFEFLNQLINSIEYYQVWSMKKQLLLKILL